jgi:hypothetical protein
MASIKKKIALECAAKKCLNMTKSGRICGKCRPCLSRKREYKIKHCKNPHLLPTMERFAVENEASFLQCVNDMESEFDEIREGLS